jgi:hypothetical protein
LPTSNTFYQFNCHSAVSHFAKLLEGSIRLLFIHMFCCVMDASTAKEEFLFIGFLFK